MLPKAATSSRPCGAAATFCVSRTRSRTASPPDRFYGELVSSLLPTGPRRKWRGFCLRDKSSEAVGHRYRFFVARFFAAFFLPALLVAIFFLPAFLTFFFAAFLVFFTVFLALAFDFFAADFFFAAFFFAGFLVDFFAAPDFSPAAAGFLRDGRAPEDDVSPCCAAESQKRSSGDFSSFPMM